MAKPLAEVLLEGMEKAKATPREYRMGAWILRTAGAEVCGKPPWEAADDLHTAAAELGKHGEEPGKGD